MPSTTRHIDFAVQGAARLRAAQRAPEGDWTIWAILAGRGFGNTLRPLAPVHVRALRNGGDIVVRWVRRSRSGFAWIDFVDAPIAEDREAYRIDVRLDGRLVRQLNVTSASFIYHSADRVADGDGSVLDLSIAQLSGTVGPGAAATIRITI